MSCLCITMEPTLAYEHNRHQVYDADTPSACCMLPGLGVCLLVCSLMRRIVAMLVVRVVETTDAHEQTFSLLTEVATDLKSNVPHACYDPTFYGSTYAVNHMSFEQKTFITQCYPPDIIWEKSNV